MILHKAHQEEAILSNVGQVGEFRIRNSAKAFNILSSGLYANKIRAIIRELSCNAVDSHIDAGKPNTPFDIHLPNQLEPWFSIRDYGTGLDHKHLTDIYTTYFESTKTGSNDFIGALGLGSKSPFSYTDNFTVTAIKNGRKGIYTAFINEKGVPSVALMTEDQTDEPAGVEVKFSVNDRYDFSTFQQEAVAVFKYFKLRPVVSGMSGFEFHDPKYAEKDIIPGVHYLNDGDGRTSIAIMGNIAYPIEIPEADKSLEKLRDLLNCGLVMEFGIGELDFQASREGLSYIPQTISAIKKKLKALNAQLAIHLAANADKITNLWERAEYLKERKSQTLWTNAVDKYVADTKFIMADSIANPQPKQQQSHYSYCNHYNFLRSFDFTEDDLATKFNIRMRGFTRSDYHGQIHSLKPSGRHDNKLNVYINTWEISVNTGHKFVINEGRVGAFRRAKEHFRNEPQPQNRSHRNHAVFVIEKFNKDLPLKFAEFFTAMLSPPVTMILDVASLRELPRKANSTRNATILEIEERITGRRGRIRQTHTWVRAGELKDFDDSKTYYYLPLKGFKALGQVEDVKTLRTVLRDSQIHTEKVYGVRKAELAAVEAKKNWINLDDAVEAKLAKLPQKMVLSLVKHSLDCESVLQYDIVSLIDANSPYAKLSAVFKSVQKADSRQLHHLERLCQMYKVQITDDLKNLTAQYAKELGVVVKRYPLLKTISGGYRVKPDHVAEYVNCIDMMHNAKAVAVNP